MKKISIILQYHENLGYSQAEMDQTLQSLLRQNYENWELLLVDFRGEKAENPLLSKNPKIFHLPGKYKNQAQGLNAALKKATGDYVLLCQNVNTLIEFRLSTLECFELVASRNPDVGMVYGDYLLIENAQSRKIIHLLDHHDGRVRDNMDLGSLFFFPRNVLQEVGGLDENYEAAALYDLRLKVSAQYRLVHIAAKTNGHVYSVQATGKKFNVFDYLLAGKAVQLEMEKALTEHLKRINAYLAPGMNYHPVEYSATENAKYQKCIASIIIPVFDRKEFIATAIDSIQAQTIQNIEVLIMVNGGAIDSTIEGVKPYLPGGKKYDPNKPAVRLFIEDINNLGFCFNKGLREASGKYYIQLDSDDRLKPDAVEKILKVFESDKRIAMVIGSYEVWKKDPVTSEITRMEEIPVVTHDEWTEENGRNNLLRINGAGAPRAAHIKIIQQLGGFGMNDSPNCRNYGEDYDLVLRMSEQYRIGRVWEPIYKVIRHAGGTDHSIDQDTIDRNDSAKDFMRLEAIRRRQKINRQQ
ncbi:glycosyltransferase [candidate division KSB1 bacterium]|nr:glycosyltransferase [candidate division KSB1 bacterium]